MRRIKEFCSFTQGVPRVDDRLIMSAIIFVFQNGLRWRDAPRAYRPHNMINIRFIRGSRLGVLNRMFVELEGKAGEQDRIMIDATHLQAYRNAASLINGGPSARAA